MEYERAERQHPGEASQGGDHAVHNGGRIAFHAADAPGPLINLQRAAGNRAVSGLIRATAFTTGSVQRQSIDEVIAKRTPEAAKSVDPRLPIDDARRRRLIEMVLGQTWVGPSDETWLEQCWGALDADSLLRFASANLDLWDRCCDRGAELDELPTLRTIRRRFTDDVLALARHHLRANQQLVEREREAVGLGKDESKAEPSATASQAVRLAAIQAAAVSLSNLQRAQEAAREAYVGWRIGDGGDVDPDFTGRAVKYQVRFDPHGGPPPLPQDPGDEYPYGDIFVYPVVPFAEISRHYEEASRAIAGLVAATPALFGIARAGSSAHTAAFADTGDPQGARAMLDKSLRGVLQDIARTSAALGEGLDPLDLTPLHEQLHTGTAPVGTIHWTGGFGWRVASAAARDHSVSKALTRLALQEVSTLAFLFAPFTSGASLVLLLAAGTTAAAINAYGSYQEAQRLVAAEGSAVAPGTELVEPGSARAAQMQADADAIAFGLALLALGPEIFNFWKSGAQARTLRVQERVRMSHGTDQAGFQGLGALGEGRIDVSYAGGAHQDLGQGFYLSLDTETAGVYAFRRGSARKTGLQHVLTFDVPKADLGVVVDIRPGGNFRRQWESFLNERPAFPGGATLPGFETNRALLARAPEHRGVVFDRFLDSQGMRQADTVLAPLGDDVFTGITNPNGETVQVCVRSQKVADRLNEQIRTGR